MGGVGFNALLPKIFSKLKTLGMALKGLRQAGSKVTRVRGLSGSSRTPRGAPKRSKIRFSEVTQPIGGGKFTRITKTIPGRDPGQTRLEVVRIKNAAGKTIRTRNFVFDRSGKVQERVKPDRGGPEGRAP